MDIKIVAERMLNEMYLNSKPKISWERVKKKYGGKKINFYDKHLIDKELCEKIYDKYKKKAKNKYEENSLAWVFLDFSPKYKFLNKNIDQKRKVSK